MSNKLKKKTISIIGTNGIPASYGGFETLAENIVKELNEKFNFIVYCSKTPQDKRLDTYCGARLIYLPLRANGWQSILFDIISTIHAWFKADTLLILGPAAGFILPFNFLFKKKLVVNHGGLNEWEREKFGYFERKLIRINHNLASKFSDYNIADNFLLEKSIQRNFNRKSIVIRYGGDHAKVVKPNSHFIEKYAFLNDEYFVSVSRAQVDNNLHLLLEAFKNIPDRKLVLVSNWQVSDYGKDLFEEYKDISNLVLLNAIYDQEELNCIRSNTIAYIHSHSRCGTSPSLVEAISLNLPIISFDVPTNRETLQEKALFFNTVDDLRKTVEKIDNKYLEILRNDIASLKEGYLWENIAKQYADIL